MSHIVEIVSECHTEKVKRWSIEFARTEDRELCYAFPCDVHGNIIKDEHYDCWSKNYEYCIEHPNEYECLGVRDTGWWYTEPAVAKCSCGREIRLENKYIGACQCECGQWYNLFGQALVDPEYWENDDDYDYDY